MIWNGAICAYSLLLFTVRSIIIYSMRKIYADNEQERKRCKRVVLLTHIIMAMINVALILPIATMIKGDIPYNSGLIPNSYGSIYNISDCKLYHTFQIGVR